MGDLAKVKSNQNAVQMSPSSMLSIIDKVASDPNSDIDKMQKLLDMHDRLQKTQAETDFYKALSVVQGQAVAVRKNKVNSHTKSTYADLVAVNEALMPVCSANGLSLSFGTSGCANGILSIYCDVAHSSGHSKKYSLDMPLDGAGLKGSANKTGVQAIGSTISYARRYLSMMIFNIATGDDVDGNESAKKEPETKVKTKLSDNRLEGAAKALRDGTYTLDSIKEKFDLTSDQIKFFEGVLND